MALQKQTLNVNFGQGLDTKTDPWQVRAGKFLALQNAVFSKGGLLQKRNGFKQLPSVSNNPTFLSTYAGNLITTGTSIQVFAEEFNKWIDRGKIQPVDLNVVPAVRAS